MFAAFAYGSLNLPPTLTVSESKVTSVTTPLSISRPLPDSDIIQTFVIFDACTLCLMIACVAASQLLIYRLGLIGATRNNSPKLQQRQRQRYNNSALGLLVTNYSGEFTLARLAFDLGLLTLLISVAVRTLAIFDSDIALRIIVIIAATTLFLAILYVIEILDVFSSFGTTTTATSPLNSNNDNDLVVTDSPSDNDESFLKLPFKIKWENVFAPLAVLSLFGAIFYDIPDVTLPINGPYGVTTGGSKLSVVIDKIDSEKSSIKKERKIAMKKNFQKLRKQKNKVQATEQSEEKVPSTMENTADDDTSEKEKNSNAIE